MIGQTTDEARAEYAAGELLKKLQIYEVLLGKRKYLAGDVRIPFLLNFDTDLTRIPTRILECHSRRSLSSPVWYSSCQVQGNRFDGWQPP
jgi:hypothetical protein